MAIIVATMDLSSTVIGVFRQFKLPYAIGFGLAVLAAGQAREHDLWTPSRSNSFLAGLVLIAAGGAAGYCLDRLLTSGLEKWRQRGGS
ncbi:hypothetical protein [Neoroseomonas lacus]|uniref:Uncharacterized protein n=1 Tax=Neoroseomonas lacus TaxID=287609 RepID=A0A917KQL8_9PROT|nr:hypothetical protein [Neoroseomonas lacus]GGJ25273.1 hypothetical protein GCM10011320_35810 [Neoroseomonas lacus]